MAASLKQKTISAMIWNFLERGGSSVLLFVTNLILARLLSPSDFGCIGMLLVFISVSDAIVDGGFGSALIQKKNPTAIDYSTIFYWNLALSVILYGCLFLSAPAIARFYKMPILGDVLRLQGLILILNALKLVQDNVLRKQMAFNKIAKINLTSILLGTGLGIILAFRGFGVWSLVAKTLCTGLIQCMVFWGLRNWHPILAFSKKSFKGLFQYGSFMFLNGVTNNLYYNVLSLIIGRSFSATSLGYYTQAKKLEDVPRDTLSSVVVNVTFPVFSEIQDDRVRVQNAAKKCLRMIIAVQFPLMSLLIVVAHPLIKLLLTEKWLPAVTYFQLLCCAGLMTTLFELNINVLKSLGKSMGVFIFETSLRGIGLCFVLLGIHWGVVGMLVSYICVQLISFSCSAVYVGKFTSYGFFKQLKDGLPIAVAALVALLAAFGLSYANLRFGNLLMLMQALLFLGIYLVSCYILKIDELQWLFGKLRGIIKK